MAEIKNKVVTVESLSALHEYNQDTFMTNINPDGSGTMTFDGNIVIKNANNGLYSVHPDTEELSSMVHMNPLGSVVIGYDGYVNKNGNSYICGKDVEHHIASANNAHYRPYYRAGDVIDIHVRTSGYVTNMGKNVFFTIPLTKPIIGEPMLDITSEEGFILRQGGQYTHGCDGSTIPKATYVQPTSYSIDNNFNSGIIVTANFEDTTNVVNNDSIGIYADLKITLLDQNEI